MSETRHLKVDCRGRPAEVELVGEGPDIVMIGAAVPMTWSRPAAAELHRHGFRVVNFDYGSGVEAPEPRSALDQVTDVLAVMDYVGVQSCVAVGLSRGAITAFGLAARHPDRVRGLVLAFPVAGFDDTVRIVDPEPLPEDGESQEAFMRRSLGRAFSEEFLAGRTHEAVELVTTSPGSVCRVDRLEETSFASDDSVVAPTLVIEGGRDQIVSPEHPARYLSAIPGSRHVLVPEAEHGWLMEHPPHFAAIVAGFATEV